MTDSDPGDLLERFRAQDEGALADLYDLMGSRAYGLAFRVLRDGPAAEDVVQQAFATLWHRADSLDGARGSIQGLLLTIVHRRAVDSARARQRLQARTAPLEVDPTDAGAGPMESVLADDEARERTREVQAALQVLPDTQRQVVLLAYFEGLSQQDIAARLDVPLGTVKSRLRLAMQRLRHEFIPPEPTPGVTPSEDAPGTGTDAATDGAADD